VGSIGIRHSPDPPRDRQPGCRNRFQIAPVIVVVYLIRVGPKRQNGRSLAATLSWQGGGEPRMPAAFRMKDKMIRAPLHSSPRQWWQWRWGRKTKGRRFLATCPPLVDGHRNKGRTASSAAKPPPPPRGRSTDTTTGFCQKLAKAPFRRATVGAPALQAGWHLDRDASGRARSPLMHHLGEMPTPGQRLRAC
jgi:hypothetical protein